MKSYTLKALIILLAFVSVQGCAPSVTLHRKTPKVNGVHLPEPLVENSIASIQSYNRYVNDSKVAIDQSTLDRMIKTFRKSNLFGNVVYQDGDDIPNLYTLDVVTRSELDMNTIGNATKGFFVGFSFYTLTPILKFKSNLTSIMTLEMTRPDGSQKVYEASTKGKVTLAIPMPQGPAVEALRSEVLLNNYNSIIKQMTDDKAFLLQNRKIQ